MQKKKRDTQEKQQLIHKMFIAGVVVALLNVISYKLSCEWLHYVSLIPVVFIIISFFQYTMGKE